MIDMIQAIDKLFKRLGATYGARWDASLGQTPLSDIKTVWAYELAPFENQLNRIAWALDNLTERCPNAIEFRNICRLAPAPVAELRLELPKADPERMRIELAKLAAQPVSKVDHKAWAKKIVRDVELGIKRNLTVILFARQALGEA